MIKTFLIGVISFLVVVQVAFSQQEKLTPKKIVKIGLLIPDNEATEARFGAAMAINEANLKSNKKGLSFQLITRSLKGAWGTGSTKAVDLIFKDHVWAILGSHYSRNAHLVEQVISKTHIVYLSSWATDPTLSQAFIPWYFSCVPNDNQQVKTLVDEIYKEKKLTNIAVISSGSFDSNATFKLFLKEAKLNCQTAPMHFIFDETNVNGLQIKLNKANIQALVFLDNPPTGFNFSNEFQNKKHKLLTFGTLGVFGETAFDKVNLSKYNNTILVSSGNWLNSKNNMFNIKFQQKYHKNPSAVAAYAYDGMQILINAIKRAWPNRAKVKANLSKINYNGVTGLIKFDEKGNRIGAAGLIKIENGNPIIIKKRN